MTSEVKYAPKAVIDELDSFKIAEDSQPRVYELFGGVGLLDNDTTATYKWVYRLGGIPTDREMAVINHYVDIERLQPERETRWTVEKEINGYTKSLVFESGETNFRSYTPNATYMFGLTEEQARGYAELFGGEPKEIK